MTFFLTWPVEAKFFFIFGCLIAIVLPTAGILRIRNNWRTRRHTIFADEERAETIEKRPIIKTGEETYFGIQAMDDDLEVDGLWNSKTSTPMHTPLPSPIIKSKDSYSLRNALTKRSHSKRTSSTSSVSIPDISGKSALKLARPERRQAAMDRSVSENMCLLRNAQHTQLDGSPHDQTLRIRSVSSPSSAIHSTQTPLTDVRIYDEVKAVRQHTGSCSTLPMMRSKTMNHHHNSALSRKKGRTIVIGNTLEPSNGIDDILQAVSALQDLEVIDHMEAHRRFHAAESGQLRPGTNRVCHSALTINRDLGKVEHAKFQSARSISWPVSQNETILNTMVPEKKPQKRVTPPVTPFRAFVKMHPPPKMCPSAWTERTQGLVSEKLELGKRVSTFTNSASTRSRSSSASSDMASVVTASESSPTSESYSVINVKRHDVNDSPGVSTDLTSEEELHIKNRGRRFKWSRKSRGDDYEPARLRKISRTRSRSRSEAVLTHESTYHRDSVHGTIAGAIY